MIAQVAAQAEATNRLAEIARDSLAESRMHFQSDQRPFIISTIAPLAPKVGVPLGARVSMVNYSKTPALQAGTYATVLIGAKLCNRLIVVLLMTDSRNLTPRLGIPFRLEYLSD